MQHLNIVQNFHFSAYSQLIVSLILSTQKKLHELASNSHLRTTKVRLNFLGTTYSEGDLVLLQHPR